MNENLTLNEVKWLCGGSLISPNFVLTGIQLHAKIKWIKFFSLELVGIKNYRNQSLILF